MSVKIFGWLRVVSYFCASNNDEMKRFLFLAALSLCLDMASAQTDSVKTETLPEVVVNADGQIETADKVVLLPTELERKHSANGFDLLYTMQTAGLEVSPSTRSITTHHGGEVVLCVNGMEVQPEDVATLRARNIRNIEYIRTPSGKYAGKAGLINFITVKMEYGGNVYLAANEGLAYKNGEYLAFTDFTRKGLTLSLTATADWAHDHSYQDGHDVFLFSDGTTLARDITNDSSYSKTNGQAIRLKLTSAGKSHRLNSYVSLARQAQPSAVSAMNANYEGRYGGQTVRRISSDSRQLVPTAYANYSLWLPKGQTLDFTGTVSFGHNNYHSLYIETGQPSICSDVREDHHAIKAALQYGKSWKQWLAFSASLTHDHNHYKDVYMGSSVGEQRLSTDVTMGLAQLSGSQERYFYYVSMGLSNSAVLLNGTRHHYCVPVAFYGGNYAINPRHSLSLNGLYTHTLFDPSNKNDMTINTSSFEAMRGNPDLAPLKVLGNTLSYNGQLGKARVSVSYDNNIYLDNIVHRFDADESTIYNTRTNDGTFYGNMLSATCSYFLLSDRLRISATAIEEYNMLRGNEYDLSRNIFRLKASATYLIGEWTVRLNYCSPYTTLDIREPYLVHRRPVYELLASWNHHSWTVEAMVHNPFRRYDRRHVTMDYGCYRRDTWNYHEPGGCNVNLKLTYSLGYGKKSERGDTEINRHLNSAIMRNF